MRDAMVTNSLQFGTGGLGASDPTPGLQVAVCL